MAIDLYLYLNTRASRHELRDSLARQSGDFLASEDLGDNSRLSSAATSITIRDDVSTRDNRRDEGFAATCYVNFHDRKLYLDEPNTPYSFDNQTIQGVMALLQAFPEADGYLEGWDARRPLLLRRAGRLVLAQEFCKPGDYWGAENSPRRALVNMAYTVGPVARWEFFDVPY